MTPASEIETCDGRIDMMIEFPDRLFIMEFKYAKDNTDRSKEALEQIKENGYDRANYIKGKPIVGVGLLFSHDKRNIEYHIKEDLYTPQISAFKNTRAEI